MVKVLFLSQQRLLRESLEEVLGKADGIEFLPPVDDVIEAAHSIALFHPDVVLIDLNPALFRVVKELQQACPRSPILVLSSYADRITQTQLALAGVQGFLSKDIGIDELRWAIREAHLGNTIFREGNNYVGKNALSTIPHSRGLTAREAEVLELVANGLANKQVAAALGISIKTVEKHRQRVMSKLQAHETAGLSWRAFCMGIGHAA